MKNASPIRFVFLSSLFLAPAALRAATLAAPRGLRFHTADPACGLPSAAFCETFEEPAVNPGRGGELDSLKWSAGRYMPQLPTMGGAFSVNQATPKGVCRAGMPAHVFPDNDVFICDANANVGTRHMMAVAGSQNYGQHSFRVRQPFDFSGRTGKIVFDAEAFNQGKLLGWISVTLSGDPMSIPSFTYLHNEEASIMPRNAIEFEFRTTCGSGGTNLSEVNVFNDFAQTKLDPSGSTPCLSAAQGKLNHFELEVSQSQVKIYGTPVSSDGITFPARQLLYTANVSLPFSRGYLILSVHNHAILKYTDPDGDTGPLLATDDAWTARFDNVGFDGPVIADRREYEAPDSLTPGSQETTHSGGTGTMNIGYDVGGSASAPAPSLTFKNVDLTNAQSAQVWYSAWYMQIAGFGEDFSTYDLHWRFNGHAWHDKTLTAQELTFMTAQEPGSNPPTLLYQGALMQWFDVPVSELKSGGNVLDFYFTGKNGNVDTGVANVDLVLSLQ